MKDFIELAKARHDELTKLRGQKTAEIADIDRELNPIKALLKEAGVLEKRPRKKKEPATQ
jgi:hypothetical protein